MSEVTILGSGPAGAAASLLLARWGHAVQLITKAGSDHRLVVSLPPSCAKLFAAIGVANVIDRSRFLRSTGNTVWWGESGARVELFADGALGWQLDVTRLADVLLAQAIAAGVSVEHRMVEAPPAGFVLDCTGRAGVVARAKGVRQIGTVARTIALIGAWRREHPWPVPDDTHTLVESYDDGWMWSVPAEGGARHVAAMVDPQRSALARGVPAKDVYLAEIRKTRQFAALTADAALTDGPWGWDASQYDATEYAGDDWLLVGDAGSFIDPLSSAGVKKALASAWLAAVAAHTCIETPAMKPHALAFFSTREREVASHLFRQSRQFLAGAAADHPYAFWDERSHDDIDEGNDRDAIQHAFDELKRRDRIAMRLTPGMAIQPMPIIRGHEIVLEPHLVGRGLPGGMRYVRSIDVVALAQLAPAATTVPDLFEAYEKAIGPVSLHDFLLALATAVAQGWLMSE